MWHRLALIVAVAIATFARLAAAETLAGDGLIMPVRPHFQGVPTLFQSPPARVLTSVGTAPPVAAPVDPITARPALNRAAGTIPPGAMCRAAIAAAEARHGVPVGLLFAIGVVESGRRQDDASARQPWPWTINAEGEGRFFDSKEQAVAWVRAAQSRGVRSIDTGCVQVNIMHHPDAFASLEQAFDPAANADYAARFLRELHDGPAGGDWMRAAGYYHSQTPELAEPYRRQVQAALSGRDPAAVAQSAAPPAGSLVAFAPMPAPGRPSVPRIIPAASGGLGRGLDAYRAAPIMLAARIVPLAVTGR